MKKIAVIGGGTMGHGIAENFSLYGYEVNLYETNEAIRLAVKNSIKQELELLKDEQFMEDIDVQSVLDRIKVYDNLKKAVCDRDYVIEAVPEDISLKIELFKLLDEYCPEHTILASNTSSLKLDEMTKEVSLERKKRVIVNHWYNPAHLMPLVEMSFFGNMPENIYEEVEKLYSSIGKQTIKIFKDIPGLVANRIQQGIAREVFSLMEMGVASSEDIDKAIKFGPAFRYATTGQLEIADFGGLDIWCIVGDNLLRDMDNSKEANKLLRQKVSEGKLGLKSGEGFYDYSARDVAEITRAFHKKLIRQLKVSKFYI